MKRIISLLMIAAMLFLCGCSNYVLPKTEPKEEHKEGLIEIEGISENAGDVLSTDFQGDHLLLVTTKIVGDDYSYLIYQINAKKLKIDKVNEISEFPFEQVEGAKYTDNGNILVYNGYESQCVTYDTDMHKISDIEDYKVTDPYEEARKNKMVDDSFACYESFAEYSTNDELGEPLQAFAFYDDKDRIYLADECNIVTQYASMGRTVLSSENSANLEKETLVVCDYSDNVIINRTETKTFENKNFYILTGDISSDYVFISAQIEDKYPENDNYKSENKYYIWNYKIGAENKPLATTPVMESEFEEMNNKIVNEMKDEYGIDIFINKPNEYTENKDEDYTLKLDASPLKVYFTLKQIRGFLTHLPQGFVKEMYTGFGDSGTKRFEIYIGSEITGTSSAYANCWGNTMEIALSTQAFNIGTLAHEFCHIIDRRIYETYDDFDMEWNKLNPENFSYFGYNNENDVEFENMDDYFISLYSLSAEVEDRAEIFSNLFTASTYDEAPTWFTEDEHIIKKAEFLCKAIRDAFPCMQNIETADWEVWIKH